jgi:hypothetical protein
MSTSAIDGLLHEFEGLVLGVAAPLVHQFGTVQPHRERIVGRGLLDRIDQFAHEATTVLHRTAVLVGTLVGEGRIEVGQQVAHEACDLGAVEAGANRALGGIGVLGDDDLDLVLAQFARRAEVRQGLRHHRGLHAIAEVDAAVASGMQDLLHGHGAGIVDVARDHLELRQELVVVDRDLAEVGLALAQRVGIGALVGDQAAAGAGDDAHPRQFARRDAAVATVVVGNAAGAVLDAVLDLELADLARLEQVIEFCFSRSCHVSFLL